jgi:hypothetical protein
LGVQRSSESYEMKGQGCWAENMEQRGESKEQRAESIKQKAQSTEHNAQSRQQRASLHPLPLSLSPLPSRSHAPLPPLSLPPVCTSALGIERKRRERVRESERAMGDRWDGEKKGQEQRGEQSVCLSLLLLAPPGQCMTTRHKSAMLAARFASAPHFAIASRLSYI